MARRESPPVDEADEPGEYVPNLDIRLPELLAARSDTDREAFDYAVGEYPIPDLEEQPEESVE